MRKFLTTTSLAVSLSLAVSGCVIPQSSPPPGYAERAQAQNNNQSRYAEPQAMSANDQVWKGQDGQYHCHRKDGTTGLVIGAAVGALFGGIVFGGDIKTLGIIASAVGGGLLGRSIEKGEVKCQ